jgi:hypothetical protein
MTAVYLLPERVRYWRDRDNVLSISKREDEVVPLVINWSDRLEGSTISSVAYVDNGVTRSNTSNTTTTSTTHVTGIGDTEVTATFASGDKRQMVVRFVAEGGSGKASDYDD